MGIKLRLFEKIMIIHENKGCDYIIFYITFFIKDLIRISNPETLKLASRCTLTTMWKQIFENNKRVKGKKREYYC